jgi:hypothetical protein
MCLNVEVEGNGDRYLSQFLVVPQRINNLRQLL